MSGEDRRRDQPTLDGESETVVIPNAPQEREKALLSTGYLTVIRGANHDLGNYVVVESSVLIGRGRDVDLRLQDGVVSRHHLRIDRNADGSYTLEDLGSTNGTQVDGQSIEGSLRLQDGNKIFLGDSVLRFALADDIDLGYQTEVAQIVGQDPLTGLPSKRRFDDALNYEVAASRLSGAPLTLLMMDMDGVKRINDTHGHLFGAHVIGETGRIIARHLDRTGRACRFGGDEFCAFLPGVDADVARDLAETIRVAVEQAGMTMNGIPLSPTLSIGIAVCPADASEPNELLARADEALYRAKAAGRNRVAN